MRTLELLAPAKDLQCGKAAIDCGADAVYIGAPKFGARAAAGNSVDDIRQLVRYAHSFDAKVYLTLNTIIYDSELAEVDKLLGILHDIGVDAILVQDMAIVEMIHRKSHDGGMRMPLLHASTQTDNRTSDKVGWLKSMGFSRVVLARELSLAEINEIHHDNPDVELEAFVHGALCVSYSGACYVSQHCFGRSANRGECAQFCRMKFDLVDSSGKEWEHQRHLLSLKDMCRIEHLEELADAGVVSFKIEGRLKDETYVRNVVAAYSQQLNSIIDRRKDDFRRVSLGKVNYAFVPDLKRTFNRGYTDYFFNGREHGIFSPDTPKAVGENVGYVKEIRHNSFTVAGTARFSNGDGLCFIDENKQLQGFRVNRAEGNRLFPLTMPQGLRTHIQLFRNNDVAFEKELMRQGTERKIPITLAFAATKDGFSLTVNGTSLTSVIQTVAFEHQEAKKPQRENIIAQLSKWGATVYNVEQVEIVDDADRYFIPSSVLSSLRQGVIDRIGEGKANSNYEEHNDVELEYSYVRKHDLSGDDLQLGFANVSNDMARRFYEAVGIADSREALESSPKKFSMPLMQCRHCLRFSLGYCVKHGGRKPEWKEPLILRLGDGRRFRLEFDCKSCQMNLYAG